MFTISAKRLSSCKQLINESYTSRKLAEDLKGELDVLHERRAELESQLKAEDYESLESEIIQLETDLQVIHDDDCIDLEEKMMNLKRKLILKDEELQVLKQLENSFRSAIQTKNEELQDARWEFIDGLKACSFGGGIGIRRMGLVDSTPFFIGKRKENAAKFSSLCRHLVEDPEWHPFTTITDGSDQKEIINEEDGKMVILKSECSDEEYRAVVTALVSFVFFNRPIEYILMKKKRVHEPRLVANKEQTEKRKERKIKDRTGRRENQKSRGH